MSNGTQFKVWRIQAGLEPEAASIVNHRLKMISLSFLRYFGHKMISTEFKYMF